MATTSNYTEENIKTLFYTELKFRLKLVTIKKIIEKVFIVKT